MPPALGRPRGGFFYGISDDRKRRGIRKTGQPNRAPEGARSREHLYIEGSGGGVRASRDAVFDRQGFVGDAAAGAEGFPSGQDSVSSPARRYELQISRDDQVSRLVRERSGRGADRAQEPESARRGRESLRPGYAEVLRILEDAFAAGRAGRRRVRRGV